MGSFISETSSYSMVAALAAFLLINIIVFFVKEPEKHNKIYFLQTLIVVIFHAVGYITLFMRTSDIRYFFFFAFQELILLALALVYQTIYRHMSHLLLNNMLMFLFVGFVILGRLAFENAVRQFIITIVAFGISMAVPWFILKLKSLKKLTYIYAGVGIFLLGAVWLTGAVTNGSRLAFRLFGMSFQPSEFIKITLVLFNAAILSDCKNKMRYLISALFTFCHIILLVLSRDLGSACIYCATYLFMVFLANKNILTLIGGMVAGSGAAVLAYKMFSHVRIRVQTWINPWSDMDKTGYQLSQSLFAIGTGGYFGMGLLKGKPYSIPYVNEDFVFSAIAEELGVVFAILLVILYLFVVLNVFRMSFRVKDEFHALTLAGCAVTLGIQVFLTVGGGTRLIPLTGVTLPLISMGGSSLCATILMFSLLQGIYIKEFTTYDLEELEDDEENYFEDEDSQDDSFEEDKDSQDNFLEEDEALQNELFAEGEIQEKDYLLDYSDYNAMNKTLLLTEEKEAVKRKESDWDNDDNKENIRKNW